MKIELDNGYVRLPDSITKRQAFLFKQQLEDETLHLSMEEKLDMFFDFFVLELVIEGKVIPKSQWKKFLNDGLKTTLSLPDYMAVVNASHDLLGGNLGTKKKHSSKPKAT